MNIVYDENIPYAREFFESLGQLTPCDGRQLTAAQLKHADVLLVRSVTSVNEALLKESPVGFVASATIGTDHVNQDFLSAAGIRFANAPGCNAHSVVDYVISALFSLAEGDIDVIRQRQIGVVGVGNVGQRLVQRLQALGIEPFCCDPPRVERGESGCEGYVDIDTLIANCDTLCLHTPLTVQGDHPTRHLLNNARLASLKSDSWLLNAGRGAVVDNGALAQLLPARPDLRVVLDVWEPEPAVNPDLLPLVTIATPHIAGYSLEGRSRGTEMIYQALCAYLGRKPEVTLRHLLPKANDIVANTGREFPVHDAIMSCYHVGDDDRRFRQMVSAGELPAGFDRLRKNYPARREFASCCVKAPGIGDAARLALSGLGFSVAD